MKRNKIIFGTCILISIGSCVKKNNESQKNKNNEMKYFESGLKKTSVDSILGEWETSAILFSESVSQKRISKIYFEKSRRINLEFTSKGKLLMNKDTIGIWYEKNHYLVLKGKCKSNEIPFFTNTHYRFSTNKFSGSLTCFFNDFQGPHHQVQYTILRKRGS